MHHTYAYGCFFFFFTLTAFILTIYKRLHFFQENNSFEIRVNGKERIVTKFGMLMLKGCYCRLLRFNIAFI